MPAPAPLIAIVEDESSIADVMVFALRNEGYRCRHHATGGACLEALAADDPAVILLDIGLPDGSGFEFFRRIRARSGVPVIFLTARGEEVDRVAGLEMGADDYVVKPFSVRELIARVRMVLRRAESRGDTPALTMAANPAPDGSAPAAVGPFAHDEARRQIRYRGQLLVLTLHEYRLLGVLMRQPGRVLTRGQLLGQAWESPDHRLERTIDSHVKSLRAKLRTVDPASDPIRTHRGLGYSLELPA